jgi:hypothetical protein
MLVHLGRIRLLALIGFIASAATTQQGKPSPVLPPEAFTFDGRWDCNGTFQGGKAHRSIYEGEVILGRTWIRLTERDVEPATGYAAEYLLGYERMWVTSDGRCRSSVPAASRVERDIQQAHSTVPRAQLNLMSSCRQGTGYEYGLLPA